MGGEFWKGKKVLVTGHTGFKGTWLSIWLNELGAKVIGYSLEKYPNDTFFKDTKISSRIIDVRGDISDLDTLKRVFEEYRPEIVFHLAAQPLVRKSFDEPSDTLKTNILGTVNVLECIRLSEGVKVGVIVTSDKCYKNIGMTNGYRETDFMGGYDPYSCSKGCAELIVDSYRNSFFKKLGKFVASARAGNVIGGGDWSEDRLIPDCVRSLNNYSPITIRNPSHTRPWQHVLEPLKGYMLLAEKMLNEKKYDEAWNFGPHISSIKPVEEIVDLVVRKWGTGKWINGSNTEDKHEASILSLDISKSFLGLNWRPKMNIEETVDWTVEWYKRVKNEEAYDLCLKQIKLYENQ